jgi:hypothetical protein
MDGVQLWKKNKKGKKEKMSKLRHYLKEIQGVYLSSNNVTRFLVANNIRILVNGYKFYHIM